MRSCKKLLPGGYFAEVVTDEVLVALRDVIAVESGPGLLLIVAVHFLIWDGRRAC